MLSLVIPAALVAALLLHIIVGRARQHRRRADRQQRRIRNMAHQRAWDWIMRRSRQELLPYYPSEPDR